MKFIWIKLWERSIIVVSWCIRIQFRSTSQQHVIIILKKEKQQGMEPTLSRRQRTRKNIIQNTDIYIYIYIRILKSNTYSNTF